MKKHVTHSLGLATTVLCWGWCVVLAPLNARAAVTFTHDTVINLGDTTYDGQDIVIQACTVTVNGAHAFKGVQVTGGGVLTHSPTTPAQDFSLQLTITNTLLVDGSSAIDVSGRGYVNDASLGALTLGNTTAGAASGSSGGSYGGLGAGGQANVTYGDYRNPNELGSAGAQGKGEGGAGGGLLRISAASAQIDGQLLANGGNAVDNGLMFNPGGAGGSGGGIWLNVGSLSGSGLIAANGGEPALQWGGGGGGGRVAVYYGAVNDFDLANRVTAHGANGNGTGSVGTVYLKPSGAPGELLLASHGTPTGVWTPLGTATDAVFQVENLVISGTNVVAAPAHQMPVQAGSVTVANGALLTHQPTTPAQEFSLRLTATNSLLVDSSSAIDVSGCGYVDDYTWGAFTLGNTTSGAAVGRSGGSYGGLGGAADGIGAPYLSGQPNSTYGDPHNPNELGSAGAGLYGFGGAGGGLVRISAATAQIDGVLLANGANPAGDGGGGSGGGIWLNVGALSGSGRIAADGGTASYWGAAGGGGRVAIYAVQWNFPKAAIAAGVGTGGPAGAQSGTVLFGPTTRLSSSRAGPSLTFSWPALATGYRLESTANLANPVTWTPVTNSVTVLGEQNTVTVDLTGPTRFFRLNQ